jgi:hypothetical protein
MSVTLVLNDPVETAITLLVVVLAAFIIVRVLRRIWRLDERASFRRVEPELDPRAEPLDHDEQDGFGRGPGPAPRRRGLGRLVTAFALGILAGIFGVPLAIQYGSVPLARAMTAVDRILADAAAAPVFPVDLGDAGLSDPPAGASLASFITALQNELPKRVDDSTTLVTANVEDRVVTFRHQVSQSLSDQDAQAYAEAATSTVLKATCTGGGGSDVRRFNDEGVEFRYIYADAGGRTLAAITLEPDFCLRTGSIAATAQ